jgi:chemotaxis protein methyltransferase CheR
MQHEFAFSGHDFSRVRGLIAAYAGISLHDRKQNMVYNRLARRLRATGVRDFGAYLDWVEEPGSEERERFVNALTTNLTAFFREPHHFEMLVALARARARGTKLRVWSSACSTGEEPYSAAIALREAGGAGEILATDVDTDALESARRGIYRLQSLEGAGLERLRPHFLKGTGANAELARVRPEVRALVSFAPRNLLGDEAWPAGERFDAVFCRNVMIYFDRPTQQRVLDRIAGVLAPGGLLFLGHSESCAASHPSYRFFGKTTYERRDG